MSDSGRPRARYGRFPGLYRFVQSRRRYADGREADTWLWEVSGYTFYDRTGWMWVLLTPRVSDALGAGDQPLAAGAAPGGVIAYCGTYDVDASARTVVHRLEAAVPPEWRGQRFVRVYEFRQDQLTLTIREPDNEVRTTYERVVRR